MISLAANHPQRYNGCGSFGVETVSVAEKTVERVAALIERVFLCNYTVSRFQRKIKRTLAVHFINYSCMGIVFSFLTYLTNPQRQAFSPSSACSIPGPEGG